MPTGIWTSLHPPCPATSVIEMSFSLNVLLRGACSHAESLSIVGDEAPAFIDRPVSNDPETSSELFRRV
jgi:hypothetical protein